MGPRLTLQECRPQKLQNKIELFFPPPQFLFQAFDSVGLNIEILASIRRRCVLKFFIAA